MRRLIQRLAVAVALSACAAPRVEVAETPPVERLRLQITKARNAIEETRQAIARARGARWLPELYLRLAELLGEEARYHYQVAFEREQRADRALHVPQVRALKQQAIDLYRQTVRRYPDSPLVPRMLFNLGQEHRELGDYDAMRAVFETLVAEHPQSPLRHDALLVLGDDRFDRGDLEGAAQAYRAILGDGAGRLSGLAHYKQGWVEVNTGDCKQALVHFEQAVRDARAWVEAGGAAAGLGEGGARADLDVRREALGDMAYCYARERPPEGAVAFFRALAHDRGAYVAALVRLGDRYATLDRAEGAARVARELLRLAPDGPERLEDARMLHAALRRTNDFSQVGDDAALIARAVQRRIRRPDVDADTRDRLVAEFEQLVRDLATRGQEQLQKAAQQKAAQQKAPPDLALARAVAQAYRVHLDSFPGAESRLEVLQNQVDVLALAGDPFHAGRRALDAAALQAGPPRAQALYDGVVFLQDALDREGDDAVGRMRRVVGRARLRAAAADLLAAEALPPERARKVQFAIARSDYDEGENRRAIDRLTAVAFAHPGTEEGDAAVYLVLDAHKTLNDYLGLIRSGQRFLAADSPVRAEVKQAIAPVVAAAEQVQIDEIALAAAGVDGGDVSGELIRFAEQNPGTDLGERALVNAFIAARAAGDSARMYALADRIRAEYPKSPQLPGILAALGRAAAGRYELDRAVTFFAQAADADPARRIALRLAEGDLRAQLADPTGARKAYEAALAAAGSPEARAEPAGALARLVERQGQPGDVIATLEPLARDAHPPVLAALGLAYLRAGRVDEAEGTLQRVLDATGADAADRAAAHYGQAEVFARILAGFDPGADIEAIYELVSLIEVTQQTYLKAAREAHPVYTPAALGRLARMGRQVAARLRALPAPTGVDAATARALADGLARRAAALEAEATEALAACAGQAWSRQIFSPPVRACLTGEPPAADPVQPDRLAPRAAPAETPALADARAKVAAEPESAPALVALGAALIDANDPHAARLVLARAATEGAGPEATNLLGLASFAAGDAAGALEAFARAAAGDHEPARQNLADALRRLGLAAAADEALRRFEPGEGDGRRLGAGR